MNHINSRSNSKNWRHETQTSINSNIEVLEDEEFSCILPASPNWYSNSIISCLNGYCAFGGKNSVFIFDLKTKPPVCKWSHAGVAVTGKINSVVLMCIDERSDGIDHVALGADDGLLKILKIDSKSSYKELGGKHKNKVIAVCWSPLSPKTLVSGDEKGCLLVWGFEEKVCNVWNPLSGTLSCMSLSLDVANYVLLGYTNGNILIGNTQKLEVLQNFKNHTHEICSLSWKPLSHSEEDTFFVSGSKDRTLRVWNFSQAKETACYTVPKHLSGGKQHVKAKIFNSVLWLNDFEILSGYHSGELLSWDTSNGKWKIISNSHQRLIFAICKDNTTDYFVSVSMDRQIIFHNPNSSSYELPSFGGFIYSASITPINPHKLALGIGDNTIRVWTTGISTKPYDNSTIWQGIKTKVTVLLCHPTKEGIIGYGTEDGHVGCFSSISQKSDISNTYHKKTVYALSWGPFCCVDETEEKDVRLNCLFSVGGEGTVFMHKMGAFNEKAVNICDFVKDVNKLSIITHRSEVAWHPSYEYLAVGNEDGSIDIFKSRKLILISKVHVFKKMVNTLAWHPDHDEKVADYMFWLACGSNDETVNVVDLKNFLSSDDTKISVIDQPHHSLVGHSGRITKVSWSPYQSGILASSSYDGSVQVWDVNKNEGLANYRGHIGRVYCVAWSYNNPRVLFSGGEDFCLHRWKYTEQINKLPSGKKVKSKSKKKKKGGGGQIEDNKEEEILIQNILPTLPDKSQPEAQKITVSAAESSFQVDKLSNESDVHFVDKNHAKKPNKRAKGNQGALLKKSSVADRKKKEMMQQDCIDLASYMARKKVEEKTSTFCVVPGSEEHVNLGLYAKRKDLFRMLSTECAGHIENESFENAIQLEIWRNNIGGAIQIAFKNRCLNETLVALSPLGGYDMWRSTILSYAEQLESQNHFVLASSYFIAVGDIYRAIEMFKSNNMLKEAVVLAKSHLDSNDPMLCELYLIWAKKFSDGFSYENAAECYIACNHMEEAISMLSKRNDSNAIITAMKVAEICGFEDKSEELLSRAINNLLLENKWNSCHALMQKLNVFQICHLKAVVGELFLQQLSEKKLLSELTLDSEHINNRYFAEQDMKYPTYAQVNEEKVPFVFSVLFILESKFNITPATLEDFLNIVDEALKSSKQFAVSSSSKIIQELINHLLRGIVHILQGNLNLCFKAWLLACNVLTLCGFQSMLEGFQGILFPRGIISFDELVYKFHNSHKHNQVNQSLFTNFMAYCCHGALFTKWWRYSESRQPNVTIEVSGTVENVSSFLQHACSLLLHGSYAMFYQQKEKVEHFDKMLLELDIKKRLRDHLRSKQQDKKKSKDNSKDTICEILSGLVDSVVESEERNKFDRLMEQKQYHMTLLDSIPNEIQEYSYPHPKDSLPVLLLLCCSVSCDSNKPIVGFWKELYQWGVTWEMYEQKHFIETLIQHCN